MRDIESQIICEGYHDRAFWAGMLKHVGCTDPGDKGGGRRVQVKDAYGDTIQSGNYGFLSKSNAHIKVVPTHTKDAILTAVRLKLSNRNTKPLDRLVINVDSDRLADGSPPATQELTVARILTVAQQFDNDATFNGDDILLDGGNTKISIVTWECGDAPGDGLPNQHTLERVVCAAILGAFPNRGAAVQGWLQSRPEPPQVDAKDHAFSYVAGWYAKIGSYEGFFSALWGMTPIVEQLVPRLERCGAWRIANLLGA
jgi:hypothetical protein